MLSGAGSEDMTATIAVVVDGKGYSEAVSPEGAAAEGLHAFRLNKLPPTSPHVCATDAAHVDPREAQPAPDRHT